MSYIRPLDTDSLPQLNNSVSARRVRALEEELAAFRRDTPPRSGYLQYEYENGEGNITRRAVIELQEQVRVFREEIKRKDAMLQHLVSLEAAPKVQQSTEKVVYREDTEALERARNDVAALQVKNERLVQQLKESEAEVDVHLAKVKELEGLLESKHEQEKHLNDVINSLRVRVSELEAKVESYETVSNRGEYTIFTLQKDLRDSNDKIVGLETRIRELMEERNGWKQQIESGVRKFDDLTMQLASLLHEEWDSSVSVETMVKKVSDTVEEMAMVKGKLQMQTESLSSVQLESKASRETIMRLVSEMGREQKAAQSTAAELTRVTVECDTAQVARSELEREVELLTERLRASERLHEASKAELIQRETRITKLESEIRQSCSTAQTTSISYESLREQLWATLSTVFDGLQMTEEDLKEAVRRLAVDVKEYRKKAEVAEGQLTKVSGELEAERLSHRELALRLKQLQTENADLDNKMRTAEGELAAGDVLREGFKSDKEMYLKGLQTLAEVLKMDQTSLDLGLDLTLEALIARAQQLIALECDTIAERTSQMYGLKRRIKALKDQLESKDLHLDLLRKKLTGLEEKAHGRLDMQKMAEAEALQVKKLESQVARYRLKLTDARHEIQNLKAQLLGTTELKLVSLEQRHTLEALDKEKQELEGECRHQLQKLSTVEQHASSTQAQLTDRLLVADNAVNALTSELRTTKTALDDSSFREKKLLDFRGVVCRMLGLEMNSLAVPDYDIIRRLELLIQAHHTSAITTLGLQEAISDAEDGLLTDMDIVDPVVRQSRIRCRRRAARVRARARSMSPVLVY